MPLKQHGHLTSANPNEPSSRLARELSAIGYGFQESCGICAEYCAGAAICDPSGILPIAKDWLGTKNTALKYNLDSSLTIYVQTDAPSAPRTNWLPAPKNADFSLYIRAYWRKPTVLDGAWTPPAAQPVN